MPKTIRVKNQRPGKVNPVFVPSMKGNFDIKRYMGKVFEPVFRQPMVQTASVDILIDGQPIQDDTVYDLLLSCCQGDVEPEAEEMTRSLLHQTLAHYNPNTKLLFKEMFAVAAGTETKLTEPAPTVIYTPAGDVIPAASKFMQGTVTYEEFFATLAYYCRLEAFGAYFMNEQAFDDFKAWFQQEINAIQSLLDADCLKIVSDFMALKLNGLTESFKIRNNVTDNIDDFCFARVFISLLMQYFGQGHMAGIMPFDAEELFCPTNVVLLNVERFAHSSPAAIRQEIEDIKQSINISNKVQMVSNKKLSRLAPVARALRKSASMAANAASNKQSVLGRAARTPIRDRIMTKSEYLRAISQIIKRMTTEMRTMNMYKVAKSSYARANRRNPDDYNLQGRVISTKYRPDIHVYLDTSGSVTEDQYKAGMLLCIQLARKLNVNLYINSFSHVLSQTHLLECRDKSVLQVYNNFQKIPKVSGGTEYTQIWNFINANPKRQRELSIMLTDFEYTAPSRFIAHPKNLYYMPFANIEWHGQRGLKSTIEQFMRSVEHNDPLIRNKILA